MALKRIMRRQAANDIRNIASYMEMTWGREQRKKYTHGLRVCVDDIVVKPALGISRDEIHPGLRSILMGSTSSSSCRHPKVLQSYAFFIRP